MDTRSLYETDTYRWALEQASALRRAGEARLSNAVDWANVAEEIESLGNEQAHAVESHLAHILEHLLKLEHSPASDPRNGWMGEVDHARIRLERRLARNPSLRRRLPELVADAYRDARRVAALEIERHDGVRPQPPEDCPYTPDRIRELGWFPARNETPRG